MEAAIAAARRAFDSGPWPQMPLDERRAVIRRAGELLDARADELDRIITADTGVIIRVPPRARPGPVRLQRRASTCRPSRTAWRPTEPVGRIVHEPVGVVGAIVPWNAPMALTLSKILPALLTGCTVILKPPRETPLVRLPAGRGVRRGRAPDRGVQRGRERPGGGRAARRPPRRRPRLVHRQQRGRQAHRRPVPASGSRPVGLELGGKSPVILLDDVDLATAAPAVLGGGMLLNNGEACAAWTRILVPRRRHDEMVDAFCEVVRAVRIGDPFDPRHRSRADGQPTRSGTRSRATSPWPRRKAPSWPSAAAAPPASTGAGTSSRRSSSAPTTRCAAAARRSSARSCPSSPTTTRTRPSGSPTTPTSASRPACSPPTSPAASRSPGASGPGTVGVNNLGFNMAFPFGGYKESGIGRQHGPESLHRVPRDQDHRPARRLTSRRRRSDA